MDVLMLRKPWMAGSNHALNFFEQRKKLAPFGYELFELKPGSFGHNGLIPGGETYIKISRFWVWMCLCCESHGWLGATRCQIFQSKEKRPHPYGYELFELKPGSDLLSHGNSHTIIGDESFHFWVRDGIRWYQLSIATRQTGCWTVLLVKTANLTKKESEKS